MVEKINSDAQNPIKKGLKAKIAFPVSVNELERETEIERLSNIAVSRGKPSEEQLNKKITLSPEQKQSVENYLTVAEEKLLALGIENAEELLPTLEQIIFLKSWRNDAFTADDSTSIVLFIQDAFAVSDEDTQARLFHEISHFISKILLKRKTGKSFEVSRFAYNRRFFKSSYKDRVSDGSLRSDHIFTKGIYEEPMADLFTLYCMDSKNKVYNTTYIEKDAFVIALLEEFAKITGTSPFEAFKKMFVAKTKMDFSFQKELVDIFGTEVVRGFNNLITKSNLRRASSLTEYKELAKKAHFSEKFMFLLSEIELKRSIRFSGLSGSLKPNS